MLYGCYVGTPMRKRDTLQKYPELFFQQFPKLDKVIKAKIVRR